MSYKMKIALIIMFLMINLNSFAQLNVEDLIEGKWKNKDAKLICDIKLDSMKKSRIIVNEDTINGKCVVKNRKSYSFEIITLQSDTLIVQVLKISYDWKSKTTNATFAIHFGNKIQLLYLNKNEED